MQNTTSMHELESLNLVPEQRLANSVNLMSTYHLHSNTTDTSDVHDLPVVLSMNTIQALTEEIDSKIIPFSYNTSIPKSRNAFSALDQWVQEPFKTICWTWVVYPLHFKCHDLTMVNILSTENRAFHCHELAQYSIIHSEAEKDLNSLSPGSHSATS